MRKELEDLHKILGTVCGEICMALTLYRVTGGKTTIRKWLTLVRKAEEILAQMVPEDKNNL